MNGARAMLSTLVDSGVDVCFANPGTSEMHFVAALDDVPAMRGVLCLFEGVATGAADGYARVTGRPAATLLHLGPGLGNGLANLHNVCRAHSPVVNVVGDHATYHGQYDAPLESDIASVARTVSGWYRRTARPDDVAADTAEAVAAAFGPPGCVATLVLPADASWSESARGPAAPRPPRRAYPVPQDAVDDVAKALRSGEKAALLLGGTSLRGAWPGGREPRGGLYRSGVARRDLPYESRAWSGAPGGRAARILRRNGAGPARGRTPFGAGGRGVARLVLRLSGEGKRSGSRGLHRPHAGPSRRRRNSRTRVSGRRGSTLHPMPPCR